MATNEHGASDFAPEPLTGHLPEGGSQTSTSNSLIPPAETWSFALPSRLQQTRDLPPGRTSAFVEHFDSSKPDGIADLTSSGEPINCLGIGIRKYDSREWDQSSASSSEKKTFRLSPPTSHANPEISEDGPSISQHPGSMERQRNAFRAPDVNPHASNQSDRMPQHDFGTTDHELLFHLEMSEPSPPDPVPLNPGPFALLVCFIDALVRFFCGASLA
jgi:hypothetical protein